MTNFVGEAESSQIPSTNNLDGLEQVTHQKSGYLLNKIFVREFLLHQKLPNVVRPILYNPRQPASPTESATVASASAKQANPQVVGSQLVLYNLLDMLPPNLAPKQTRNLRTLCLCSGWIVVYLIPWNSLGMVPAPKCCSFFQVGSP